MNNTIIVKIHGEDSFLRRVSRSVSTLLRNWRIQPEDATIVMEIENGVLTEFNASAPAQVILVDYDTIEEGRTFALRVRWSPLTAIQEAPFKTEEIAIILRIENGVMPEVYVSQPAELMIMDHDIIRGGETFAPQGYPSDTNLLFNRREGCQSFGNRWQMLLLEDNYLMNDGLVTGS